MKANPVEQQCIRVANACRMRPVYEALETKRWEFKSGPRNLFKRLAELGQARRFGKLLGWVLILLLTLPLQGMVAGIEWIGLYVVQPRRIRRRRAALDARAADAEVSEVKRIEDLWRLHGFYGGQPDITLSVECLSQWIEILYGKETAQRINIRERWNAVLRELGEVDPGVSLKRLFAVTFDTVVYRLDVELPPYA